MRTRSAFQSLRRAVNEALLRHFGKNWMPWLLIPCSCTALLARLHRLTPHTCSRPLTATGEPAGAAALAAVAAGGALEAGGAVFAVSVAAAVFALASGST